MKAAAHQDRQNREVSLENGHKGSIFESAASWVARPAALACKAPPSLLPARGPLPQHRASVLHRAPTRQVKMVHQYCVPPWCEDQRLCARLHTVNCPAVASVPLSPLSGRRIRPHWLLQTCSMRIRLSGAPSFRTEYQCRAWFVHQEVVPCHWAVAQGTALCSCSKIACALQGLSKACVPCRRSEIGCLHGTPCICMPLDRCASCCRYPGHMQTPIHVTCEEPLDSDRQPFVVLVLWADG